MNYKLAQIKEMAKIYRELRGYEIRKAVHEANVAYELFRDAEFEVMVRHQDK